MATMTTQRAAAGTPVSVWLTLPVGSSGLTAEGLGVLNSMLAAGVDLAGVNGDDDGLRRAVAGGPEHGRPGRARSRRRCSSNAGRLLGGRQRSVRPRRLAAGRRHPDDRPERRADRGFHPGRRPPAGRLRRPESTGPAGDVVGQPRQGLRPQLSRRQGCLRRLQRHQPGAGGVRLDPRCQFGSGAPPAPATTTAAETSAAASRFGRADHATRSSTTRRPRRTRSGTRTRPTPRVPRWCGTRTSIRPSGTSIG